MLLIVLICGCGAGDRGREAASKKARPTAAPPAGWVDPIESLDDLPTGCPPNEPWYSAGEFEYPERDTGLDRIPVRALVENLSSRAVWLHDCETSTTTRLPPAAERRGSRQNADLLAFDYDFYSPDAGVSWHKLGRSPIVLTDGNVDRVRICTTRLCGPCPE